MDWNLLRAMFSGGFVEMWSPVTVLLLLIIGWAYLRASASKLRPNVTLGQKLSFLTGLAVYYIAAGSPLDYVGHHYFFSVHMLNQSLLYLIMPLFLLYGTPGWMLESTIRFLKLEAAAQFAVRPLIALFSFNLLFSFYHIPMVMNAVMSNEWLHVLYSIALLISSLVMWFPIIGNVDKWMGISDLKKMGYIFLNGILLTPACALIIFAGKPLYEMYQGVTMPIEQYTIVEDQQLGGTIMKIIQELTYGITLAITFFRWFRSERKKDELSDEPSPEMLASMNGRLNRA